MIRGWESWHSQSTKHTRVKNVESLVSISERVNVCVSTERINSWGGNNRGKREENSVTKTNNNSTHVIPNLWGMDGEDQRLI